ncbi:hypothetical protein LMG29542_02250 [Paraburkholderia humisilvae]|uniref:Uncharacterized protein n=2 Tax=Paraburkholderia humisilvae TaxID=627669 RepID=A0A6J5DM66_9BURK|nr:hypothetical protein LMG29542_02250 [Paraburkholderia humisilvae]
MDTSVKNAPQRIYLNLGDMPPGELEFASLHEVSWCVDKQNDNDIEYVHAALARSIVGESGECAVVVARQGFDRPRVEGAGQKARKALSPAGPLERPLDVVMAEISIVRPMVDQFIEARRGGISAISYADLLAFASTVHRETLSGVRRQPES